MLRRQGLPEIYKAVKVHSSVECCRGKRIHHTCWLLMARVKLQYNITVRVKTQICVRVKIRLVLGLRRLGMRWTWEEQWLWECIAVLNAWEYYDTSSTNILPFNVQYCLLMFKLQYNIGVRVKTQIRVRVRISVRVRVELAWFTWE